EGASREEAAKIGGMDRQTLRDWVTRFNEQGADGLINIPSPGMPPKLNAIHVAIATGPSASTSNSSSFHWPDGRLTEARLRISVATSRALFNPERSLPNTCEDDFDRPILLLWPEGSLIVGVENEGGCRREWCWNLVTRSPAFREYLVRRRGQSADRWALWRGSANHQPCAC